MNPEIRILNVLDFTEVLALSDKLLGKNYLETVDLSTYLNSSDKAAMVATFNQELAGFILLHTVTLSELLEMSVCDHDWFISQYSNTKTIGVLKTIAVDPTWKNKGIATALTHEGIKYLKLKNRAIISMCWDQKEDTPFAHVLVKCGFQLIRTIPSYWSEDSLNKEYGCKICGPPPCLCNAMIFSLAKR
jgi:ribosomal protein S18 acetylase RimI-like enzyme